jgi:hypothetical protein
MGVKATRQAAWAQAKHCHACLPEMTAADTARLSDIAAKCGARGRFFVTDIQPAPR